MGGFNVVTAMVRELIKSMNITVPVALHLDHGDSFEVCKEAIDNGFTSVMIDASHYEYEENVRITKEVVEYAKKYNVSVEAELGRVGGQEDNVVSDGVVYADVDECTRFVEETGIDCLAPALGSVHGPYKGEPKLGFKEMLEIKESTNKPLVLHGGSGIPDYQIKEAISRGTCKINVNTECQQEWTKLVRETLSNDSKVYDPRKVIGPGMKGIEKVVNDKIVLFGSENKA
jgi:fructose-bisphosphate aldolase class II